MKLLLTFSFLLFYCDQSFGQSWEELNKKIEGMFFKGEYEKAIPVGQKALELAQKDSGEFHSDYTASLNNLATLYEKMGQFEKAIPLHIKALEILKIISGEENVDYATVMNGLALNYYRLDRIAEAEKLYLKAKDIQKRVLGEENEDFGISMNNLALIYTDIGQYEKAEPFFTRTVEIFKIVLGEDHPFYITTVTNLADLYMRMDQYDTAEILLLRAKDLLKRTLGEEYSDYANILNALGALYRNSGKYAKAEPFYLQAKEIRKKKLGENHFLYAQSLNNLAVLYKDMGQYEKAEPLIIQTKEIQMKILGTEHNYYANTVNNMADLYACMGQYEKAELFITESKNIELKNMRSIFNILSEKEKRNYLLNKNRLTGICNSFLYNYHNVSPSFLNGNFNLQLILKCLTLGETTNMLTRVMGNKDTSVQKLYVDWRTAKKELAKQYSLPIVNRRVDIRKAEEETERLEKELSQQSEDFRKQQNAVHTSMKEVQKNLQKEEVAIEFVSFRLYNKKWTDSTIYAAYILTKNDSIPDFVPLFEEKQLLQLQQLLGRPGKITEKSANIFYPDLTAKDKNTKQGEALYKLIWLPLEPYLTGIKKISYSPAGKLFSIAFNALFIGNDSLLTEKYQLQQYTSTRQVALRNTENQNVKPANITLFGNANFSMDSMQLTKQRTDLLDGYVSRSIYSPSLRGGDFEPWGSLPGTAEEVNAIKQLFDKNKIATRSFAQAAASEENLKALSGNSPQILHIATHGFFLPDLSKAKKDKTLNQGNVYTLADDPLLRTGLILSGGNYAWSGKAPVEGVEDGVVTAYEIAQLNLSNTELVVLSACETALGDVKGSEGVFGLQRALKMAGVKKMIVSLWRIPDKETAELMNSFYTYWMKGNTINDAFTQAQADMRKKYPPFYWAAFVLVE